MKDAYVFARQGIVILVIQLIVLEGLLSLFGYIIKLPIVSGWFDSLLIYTIFTIIIQTINIVILMTIVLRWANTQYRLENGSLIVRRGLFTIREKTYALDNVETVEVEQGIISRLLGYGTLHIYSPLFQEHVYIWGIPKPEKFAHEIKQYIPTGTRISVAPKR